MTNTEKDELVKLATTFKNLPVDKQSYILGFAEGLAEGLAVKQEGVIENECNPRQQNGDSTPE